MISENMATLMVNDQEAWDNKNRFINEVMTMKKTLFL